MKVKLTPEIFDKILKRELKKTQYYQLHEEENSTDTLLKKFGELNKAMENSIKWIEKKQQDD